MARMKHGSLTANSVATVPIDGPTTQITVTSRTYGAEIFFTVDGSTPSVNGDDSYICLGTRAVAAPNYPAPIVVKLISTTDQAKYSIAGESL